MGQIVVNGKKLLKGRKMTHGTGWRLVATNGDTRYFSATLKYTLNIGGARIAVFSVPKQ